MQMGWVVVVVGKAVVVVVVVVTATHSLPTGWVPVLRYPSGHWWMHLPSNRTFESKQSRH